MCITILYVVVLSCWRTQTAATCSAEVLLPAIEEKKRATRKFYKDGDASSKIKMTELRRQVADLVEAAKIRWIEKKVEEMENK